MKFSQRVGETSSTKLVQHESIDDDLKNSLWSVITLTYFDKVVFHPHRLNLTKHCNLMPLIQALWLHHFKVPVDTIPYEFSTATSYLRDQFFDAAWYRQLDFIEACANNGPPKLKNDFIALCNSYLLRENSAYRFVDGELSEITSEAEISAVETAIRTSGQYTGVKEHLKTALNLMNDRSNPDYRNSIKESISAVESLAKVLSGDSKATLGQALKVLEENGNLHQALKSAFSSLYGYTNDEGGIRHALLAESTLEKADARFMLVSCSAFTNYLIELNGE
ncbi:MAG: hypothetical protein KBT63_09020 [Porticoccaceae bacterium]|nr:hypothetical protein [Porticoccaceae bacterium]